MKFEITAKLVFDVDDKHYDADKTRAEWLQTEVEGFSTYPGDYMIDCEAIVVEAKELP